MLAQKKNIVGDGQAGDGADRNIDLNMGSSPAQSHDVQEPSELDILTYVPVFPGTNDETEDTSDKKDCLGQFERPAKRVDAPRYNSRNVSRFRYSSAALPDAISTGDERTLLKSLALPERKEWNGAVREEFTTLTKNGTWKEGISPSNARPLPSGIILKLKRDAKGRLARFKALLARGNFRNEFVAYAELCATVASIELVCALLSAAVAKKWDIHQLDVKGVFFHAPLPESNRLWVRLPNIKGIDCANGQVVLLIKFLYGIRQAPKLWYQLFVQAVKTIGLRRAPSCNCLLISSGPDLVRAIVYVDGILVLKSEKAACATKKKLGQLFTVTDLCPCSFLLEINIIRKMNFLYL